MAIYGHGCFLSMLPVLLSNLCTLETCACIQCVLCEFNVFVIVSNSVAVFEGKLML